VIKSQLVLNIAGQLRHMRNRDVEKVVNAILDEIVAALARSGRVEVRGFGSFSVKVRGGRLGGNPKTGVTVHVPERRVAAFRPSKEMSRRLNSKSQN